jgi:DNA-binding NtrC family response regulator
VSANRDELMPITGHVIIIEDDPVVRMLLRETLAEIGFTSATFDNAVAALTHLMQIQGDCRLIIADQGLPEGVQGTGFIRMAQERWPSIPAILTSDYLVDEQVIPPTTTYLSKPYTLEQLEKTIATVLRGDRRP